MLSHGPGLDGLAFSLELQPGDLLVINDRVCGITHRRSLAQAMPPCIMTCLVWLAKWPVLSSNEDAAGRESSRLPPLPSSHPQPDMPEARPEPAP